MKEMENRSTNSASFTVGRPENSVGAKSNGVRKPLSDYEKLRLQRIRENQERLKSLGVTETVDALRKTRKKRVQRRARSRAAQKPVDMETEVEPTRRSKRLREYDEASEHVDFARLDEAPDEVRRPKKRSRLLSFNDHEMSCLQITTPFTLRAEKVTVLELGSVWRDQYAQNYWSSTGCKFHHAYPVGYRATKTVFRKTYEMSIEEGETAPVFCVQDTVSGREWRGESPTNPWTAVCIHENTGQRISGPKFFGFSDLFTLKALAKNLYNEEELAAAVSGSVTFNQNMTDGELRAKEFEDRIDGCGPKMAEILAREDVTGTGGTPKSLPELAAWARLTPENRKKLYLWLTTSDCIPEKTRRWSVWYKSIAHRITDGIANH